MNQNVVSGINRGGPDILTRTAITMKKKTLEPTTRKGNPPHRWRRATLRRGTTFIRSIHEIFSAKKKRWVAQNSEVRNFLTITPCNCGTVTTCPKTTPTSRLPRTTQTMQRVSSVLRCSKQWRKTRSPDSVALRAGLNGRLYQLILFRTVNSAAE